MSSYKFSDRSKEWTSWAGIALSALAVVIPQILPPNTWWTEGWEAAQMALGIALIFIPHTAGTTAVENDAWALLKAFAAQLPPAYSGPMQPLVQSLAAALAHAEINNPLKQSQAQALGANSVVVPARPVVTPPAPPAPPAEPTPVVAPAPVPAAAPVPPAPMPAPIVAPPAQTS